MWQTTYALAMNEEKYHSQTRVVLCYIENRHDLLNDQWPKKNTTHKHDNMVDLSRRKHVFQVGYHPRFKKKCLIMVFFYYIFDSILKQCLNVWFTWDEYTQKSPNESFDSFGFFCIPVGYTYWFIRLRIYHINITDVVSTFRSKNHFVTSFSGIRVFLLHFSYFWYTHQWKFGGQKCNARELLETNLLLLLFCFVLFLFYFLFICLFVSFFRPKSVIN